MNRLSKYFPLIIAAFATMVMSSCGPQKKVIADKTNTNNIVSVPAHKTLTPKEHDIFTETYFDASKLRIQGDYDKAIKQFKACLEIDPSSSAANYQVADMYDGYYKQSDSAMNYAYRAMQLDTTNKWCAELYAQCLYDQGRFKEIIPIYQRMIQRYPDNLENYYKLAQIQTKSGDYEKAADTYEMLQQKEGGFDADLINEKVRLYEGVKDFTKAEAEVHRLITHDSTDVLSYVTLGDIYQLEGQSDKAFAVYQDAGKRFPDDPSVHLALADYYRQKNDYGTSFKELDIAFKQPSMDVDTKRRILLSFNSLSNGHDTMEARALELCHSMVQASPKEPEAHRLYGDFLFRAANYKDAREQYYYTLGEDSSKYLIWSQVMSCDLQLNDYADLAKCSAGAMELFPDEPEPYLFNGVANNQLKNYSTALASLNKGVEFVINNDPLMTEFCASLGDIYNSVKNYKGSDSAYEAALKINPQNDNVLNNYSYYLSVRDTNLAKAEQMSKQANEISPNNGTYLDTYAWILYMEGNYKDAKTWEDKSLMFGGQKDMAVLDHYGDILFKLGDKDGALNYWQKAKDGGMKSDLLNRKIQDKQLYDK